MEMNSNFPCFFHLFIFCSKTCFVFTQVQSLRWIPPPMPTGDYLSPASELTSRKYHWRRNNSFSINATGTTDHGRSAWRGARSTRPRIGPSGAIPCFGNGTRPSAFQEARGRAPVHLASTSQRTSQQKPAHARTHSPACMNFICARLWFEF